MQQYTVTGMHCAACSASVEKAVKVPGVTSCAVSLLTELDGRRGYGGACRRHQSRQGRGLQASVRGQGGRSCGGRKDARWRTGRRRILKSG